MALASPAPGQKRFSNTVAQLGVQLALREPSAVAERGRDRLRDLLESLEGSDPLRPQVARGRWAELLEELRLVLGDESTTVERAVLGRERVDRAAQTRPDEDLTGVYGTLVALEGDAVVAGGDGERGRAA